ncbi:lytic polysaccharide monooxygenase [Trametes coccinea BRFM310]|uniref:lytic cellulose monooxygenase (C4-dehydrogenating) n=1 Tax=Trametes coccinea (strain BRFM310) TaxID=1353009 RepID=A0A1Y2IBX6_TRAC3|nr:lytic polysaccharide monooxygenase [Trametes coccinea BRFM310]
MKAAVAAALSLLAAVPLVSAHGYVANVTIDGKAYKGNTPNSNSVQSPIRMINDVSPVKGTDNQYLSCGQNAQKAALVADAAPGSKVSFQWVSGTGGNWPHNVGPLMTYMASCGSTGCASFDSANAKWFKIQEDGLHSDGTWAMNTIYQGKPAEIQLPSNIAPGEYLIRHEILALHTAMSLGGAEFYPSCTQLKISGSQTGTPNETVSFPGAYSDTDPGILIDAYDLKTAYIFPGPAVSNLAGKTILDGVAVADTVNSTTSSSTKASTSTAKSTSSTKQASTSTAHSSSSTKKTSTSTAKSTSSTKKASTSTAHSSSSTKKSSTSTAHSSSSTKKASTSTAHSSSSTKKASTSTAHSSSSAKKASSTAPSSSSTKKASTTAHSSSAAKKVSSSAHVTSSIKATSSTAHVTSTKAAAVSTTHASSTKTSSTAHATTTDPVDDDDCDYEEEEEVVVQPRRYSRVMAAII